MMSQLDILVAEMKSMKETLSQLSDKISKQEQESKKNEPIKEPDHITGTSNSGPSLKKQNDDHVNEVSHQYQHEVILTRREQNSRVVNHQGVLHIISWINTPGLMCQTSLEIRILMMFHKSANSNSQKLN